jgi:membrane-bound lytic murein transglycosylase A
VLHSAFSLQEISFADLPNWDEDDPRGLFPAFSAIESHLASGKGYKSGALGLTSTELQSFVKASKAADLTSASSARLFFEQAAVPFKIEPKDSGLGFVTGFYEPAIKVARTKSAEFPFPIYRRPPDLVDVKNLEGNHALDPSFAFARKRGDSVDVYPNRQEIESGYLNGQGLEIAWARSKVEVFFVHIQGAARLLYHDGSVQRITYDGKSGHPFTPIGRLLIERGEIARSTVSMQTIRDWLLNHPDQADEVMWNNHSFIFFREADVASDDQGPIAAAKVPLVAGRSLAVDKNIHTFGFPFYISAQGLTHLDEGRDFARLMLALDTGSAIIGPARGDIFTGSGYEAGEQAGTIKHPADFYILIPKDAAQRYRA